MLQKKDGGSVKGRGEQGLEGSVDRPSRDGKIRKEREGWERILKEVEAYGTAQPQCHRKSRSGGLRMGPRGCSAWTSGAGDAWWVDRWRPQGGGQITRSGLRSQEHNWASLARGSRRCGEPEVIPKGNKLFLLLKEAEKFYLFRMGVGTEPFFFEVLE